MLNAQEMKQKFDEGSNKLFESLFSKIEQKFLSTREQSIIVSINKNEIKKNDIYIITYKLKELGYKCNFDDEIDYSRKYSTNNWEITVSF
jgi:hypothetical protein